MVAKILGLTPLHQTTLLKSDQHKESSFLTGLGRGSYSLSPFGPEWVWLWAFHYISPFPIHLVAASSLWAVVQKFATWTVPELMVSGEIRAEMSWRYLDSLKIVELFLSRWRRWHAAILLFFSKIRHGVGSTNSRYAVLSLSASVQTSWGPRMSCSQLFKCWVDYYLGSSYFPQSTQWYLDPIIIL